MARLPDLELICAEHNLKLCSVEQIIEYRLERERLVERIDPIEGAMIETPEGSFRLIAYQSAIDPMPHLALTVGDIGALDRSRATCPSATTALIREPPPRRTT
jgi:3,4-dihydroxy 2-butanone 4-phosphate synthase/GTP cyclohydrolase II